MQYSASPSNSQHYTLLCSMSRWLLALQGVGQLHLPRPAIQSAWAGRQKETKRKPLNIDSPAGRCPHFSPMHTASDTCANRRDDSHGNLHPPLLNFLGSFGDLWAWGKEVLSHCPSPPDRSVCGFSGVWGNKEEQGGGGELG